MKWINALKAGERLTHASTWKNTQVAVNLLVAVVTVMLSFVDMGIDIGEKEITIVATAVVAVVNIYFTHATSRKIGIRQ